MTNSVVLFALLFAIVLFFWGLYKTLKTQNSLYALAMLPFFMMVAAMFIR